MMYTRAFYAMGSHMQVWSHSENDVLDQVVARFAAAEKQLSRFLPSSELSQLNERSGEWVVVSADFWLILTRALDLAAVTNGRFDPTLLSALETAGYNESFNQLLPQSEPRQAPRPPEGYRSVELDRSRQAVRLPRGMRVDLGGIAKGYTAQRAVWWLDRFGPCLLDAGGDLVAGDAPHGSPGWAVGIAAPWSESAENEQPNLLRLWLENRCLATSGVDYRRWQQGEKMKHHIIDPVSGDSAETDLLTTTVLHADACYAEAWATAALVAGHDHATQLLTQNRIKAALIDHTHQVTLTPALRPLVQWESDRAGKP